MLWGGLPPDRHAEAAHHAEIAAKAMPENAATSYALGMLAFVSDEPMARVIEYLTKAVELEPSNAMYHAILGFLLGHVGQSAEGVGRARYAMRLAPNDSREPFLCYMLANALIADDQFEEGIDVFSSATRFTEVDFVCLFVAYAYFRLGQTALAREALNRIKNPRPFEFYSYAVRTRLWLHHPTKAKEDFLNEVKAAVS